MRASIKLEGFDRLIDGFKGLAEASKNRIIRNASRAGANIAKRAIQRAAPKGEDRSVSSEKYGPLHKNIKIEQLKGKKYLPYYRVTTGKAFWGGFLDQGTKHIDPNLWFRNAVEEIRGPVTTGMIENIQRSIMREVAKIK